MSSPTAELFGKTVVFCCDGSGTIGFGHVIRSLAVAHEVVRRGATARVLGAGVEQGAKVVKKIPNLHIENREKPLWSAADAASICSTKPDFVVIDGYHFPSGFFEGIETFQIPFAVLDDNGETACSQPRIVVNPSPAAPRELYANRFPFAQCLLGLEYAVIRQEILHLTHTPRASSGRLFVALGGSDPLEVTVPLVRELVESGYEVNVALGPGVANREQKEASLAPLSGVDLVSPDKFVEALASASLCLLGAGSLLWEANALRKQTIALIIADNQVAPSLAAHQLGIVANVVDFRARVADDSSPFQKAVLDVESALAKSDPTRYVGLDGPKKIVDQFAIQINRRSP